MGDEKGAYFFITFSDAIQPNYVQKIFFNFPLTLGNRKTICVHLMNVALHCEVRYFHWDEQLSCTNFARI